MDSREDVHALFRKLKKINRRARDSLLGIYDSYITLNKIYSILSGMIADIGNRDYDEAAHVFIVTLSKEWHDYIRYCSYSCLTNVADHTSAKQFVKKALSDFCNDSSNTEIIEKAQRAPPT